MQAEERRLLQMHVLTCGKNIDVTLSKGVVKLEGVMEKTSPHEKSSTVNGYSSNVVVDSCAMNIGIQGVTHCSEYFRSLSDSPQ